jgi:hypothetical protein
LFSRLLNLLLFLITVSKVFRNGCGASAALYKWQQNAEGLIYTSVC